MNAVEIEAAVSALAAQPFDAAEFPFAFLAAFGNKETTLKRLRKGDSNASDVPGGVLQRGNIHLAVCPRGRVGDTLRAVRASPKTVPAKAKFVLATDGDTLEAEDLASGETIASDFASFANHFGFFLPLAGISTIKEIKDNPIDVRATGRLNKLYIELLKENPDWATAERRHDMNHFMARLIFCFFAEDTDIFRGNGTFTSTVDQMSASDGSNTHEVIGTLFRVMNTHEDRRPSLRAASHLPGWADTFPYVNGGLFSGAADAPRFSRIARSYLLRAGELRWREINPDIFGSMIQAVADDEERGALGMHYTSVPNILKVLNPLFLDDLRAALSVAGDNPRTLLNLRRRVARIRVFDPACGSGNFLVIAYKKMREIEAEINRRRGEPEIRTEIPLTNFRGIELRDFPAEIARLALVIAEFQADVLYRGPLLARKEFLPLNAENWITCGNALRINWLSICPPTGGGVKLVGDDLFSTPLDQAQIEFENEGGETYICGNPPYSGSVLQTGEQKDDLRQVFEGSSDAWKSLDYVCGWFIKAVEYGKRTRARSAFVATNSICQGEQVPILWPLIFENQHIISFAYTSFEWANLASNKAGVTVIVVGLTNTVATTRKFYSFGVDGMPSLRIVKNIGPYLVPGDNTVVSPRSSPLDERAVMVRGNMANDGGHLILSDGEAELIRLSHPGARRMIKRYVGSKEFIHSTSKHCLWIVDSDLPEALSYSGISVRLENVRKARLGGGSQARAGASTPHRFVFAPHREGHAIVVPRVSSELRDFLPVGVTTDTYVVSERNFALYDAPLWNMALIASRLHWVWIGTVCVRMRTDFSYSNTLGWNTFPVPPLTDEHKAELTRCAEDILLAREAHFPATIAELYRNDPDDPAAMPDNLRRAHDRNDETLERIYIGRRFRNDTERLEKLFELYTKMTAARALLPTVAGKQGVKKSRKARA